MERRIDKRRDGGQLDRQDASRLDVRPPVQRGPPARLSAAMLSAMHRSVRSMTMKRSDFGSLSDRLGRTPRRLDELRVRHVWLDSTVAALVVDRRKTAGQWEGLVARVEDGELLVGWVNGDRISNVEQPASLPQSGLAPIEPAG